MNREGVKLAVSCTVIMLLVLFGGMYVMDMWQDAHPPCEVGDIVDNQRGVVFSNDTWNNTIIITFGDGVVVLQGNNSMSNVSEGDVVQVNYICASTPNRNGDGKWVYAVTIMVSPMEYMVTEQGYKRYDFVGDE